MGRYSKVYIQGKSPTLSAPVMAARSRELSVRTRRRRELERLEGQQLTHCRTVGRIEKESALLE